MEAFSDGVLAIIITIMILELKQPVGDRFGDLLALGPTLLAYLISFMFLAIYWVNHPSDVLPDRVRERRKTAVSSERPEYRQHPDLLFGHSARRPVSDRGVHHRGGGIRVVDLPGEEGGMNE